MKMLERIEQFLTTFSQQLSSLLNLKAMKSIDTGDRMMDTTLHMLSGTLIAGLATFCLALYKQKGLIDDMIRLIKVWWGTASYNPLEFDPSLADGKPKNGKKFLYESVICDTGFICTGMVWFLKYHKTKFYVFEKQDKSLTMTVLSSNPVLGGFPLDNDFIISKDVFVPVWRDLNGYWVYMYADDENIRGRFRLVSDSYVALENCYTSIYEVDKKLREEKEQKEKEKKNVIKLYEVQDGNMVLETGTIPLNKVFDTLFFEQKNEILSLLKDFKENTLFPAHIPLDNKLGILLHGPPGTGKTGFISALANYLQRYVVLVDMTKITTQKNLNDLLTPSRNKNCIFVFEEIDCMPCILKREETQLPQLKDTDKVSPDMMLMMSMHTKDAAAMEEYKKEKAAAKDKIDLGYLLRKLDGLESADGRIIIATTNHPERIDPALLRPGRFGIQIHLKKANQEVCRQILEMVYKTPVSEDDVYEIEDYKWSPAEILQKSLMYKSAGEVLAALRNEVK